jgi:co-chaperonin GroES (HSP10)
MSNKKHFAVSEHQKSNGKVVTMQFGEVKRYLVSPDDSYNHLREKVWYEGITLSQFQYGMTEVEASINKLKAKEESVIVYPLAFKDVLEDRILVYQHQAEVITKGGVYIPDRSQQAPAVGTVVGVGPGKPGKDIFELAGYLKDGAFVSKEEVTDIADLKAVYNIVQMNLKLGDKVLFGKQAGLPVKDPETKKEYLIMRVTDCFVKL